MGESKFKANNETN